MAGVSEILVLVLLICVVLIIPRMMAPAAKKPGKKLLPRRRFTAGMRAGIVLSVLVPVISALICTPWSGTPTLFIITGVLPVALAWALVWILSARKK